MTAISFQEHVGTKQGLIKPKIDFLEDLEPSKFWPVFPFSHYIKLMGCQSRHEVHKSLYGEPHLQQGTMSLNS